MGQLISGIIGRSAAAMVLLIAGLAMLVADTAAAQGMFSPARKVNDRIITNYDVAQRIRFMELLNVGAADMRREAIDRLTEEVVQMQYAARKGIRLSRADIATGMAEFASRVELSTDEFLAALAENGVARESFEQFVTAGLMWRRVAEREFPGLVSVSSSDVARARDVAAIRGTQRVLLSEIFLPTDPEFAEAVAQIMEMIEAARNAEEFSNLAREFSLAGSRDSGGRLDWMPLDNLPGQIAGLVSAAAPGQVIGPIELGGAIAYFQLRATDSTRDIPADRVELRYKRLLLPGGRSDANMARVAQMRATVRDCAELGSFATNLPETALVERTELQRNIAQSDAIELARLDRNQISANTMDGANLVVLMLCARQLQFDEPPTDVMVENMIFDRQVDALARVRLEGLIADSDIRDY